MATAFQPDAFQNNAFQIEAALDFVTGTDKLQLPVNCVLAGQQGYEQGGYDNEEVAPNYGEDIRVSYGGGGRLSDSDSTFTTKTTKRGYD